MKQEERLGLGEMLLLGIVLVFVCGWLSMARDDIRGGRDSVTALMAPNGGSQSAPRAVQSAPSAPQYLPVAGEPAAAPVAPAPPACPGPDLASCPNGHLRTTGPCSWICEAVP